jgi:hypothetical protein
MVSRSALVLPAPSHVTQFPGHPPDAKTSLPVTMGIDWGTSFTKIVLRVGERALAVRFTDAEGVDAYLRPSLLQVDPTGRISDRRFGEGRRIGGLKMALFRPLDARQEAEDSAAAAAYLADVVRASRTWFLRTQAGAYRGRRLRWRLHVGLPAEGFANEALVERLYRIAQTAWHLSTQPGPLRLESARRVWRDVGEGKALPGLDCEEVDVLPEIGAQIVGYAHEPRARAGLRVLMDIGAMTVDLAGFALFEPTAPERFACYSTHVSLDGVQNLHRNRIHYLLAALKGERLESETFARLTMAMRKMEDPGQPVPRHVKSYLSGQLKTLVSAPDEPDTAMAGRCRQALQGQVSALWRQKATHQRSWKEGLPIFVTGGGCTIPVYQQAIRDVSRRWEVFAGVAPFRLMTLAPPPDIESPSLPPAQYHRLSVAYGLSYPAEEIGALAAGRARVDRRGVDPLPATP